MIKKLLAILAIALPLSLVAQQSNWRVHPFYVASKVQNIVDTHNRVYYLVGGNLYCYDKATTTNESLNGSNKLSDVTITGMYYNDIKDYVLLTYDNSNIDILLGDGRVVNIPEVRDAVVPQSKAIKHVTFDNGHAYVATAFGYVVIDDVKWAITENRYYGVEFSTISRVGDRLVGGVGPNVRATMLNVSREKYTAFYTVKLFRESPTVHPVDDTHFFVNSRDSLEFVSIVDNTYVPVTLARNHAESIQRTPTGFVACFPADGFYITTDAAGGNVVKTTVKGEMVSCCPTGDGTMWAMGPNGLHRVGDNSGSMKPDGIGINTTAYWAAYNPGDKKMYLSSTTDNAVLSSANKGAKTEIWAYDGNHWQDVTPANVPLWNNGADTYQGNYWLNFVPGTTCQYVCATRAAGVMNVIDGNVVARYHYASDANCNIPLKDKYKSATAIDSAGNLWLVQSYKNMGKMVAVLPRDKFMDTSHEVVTDDWITPTVSGVYAGSFKCSAFVISQGTDIKVFSSGGFQKPIVMWDNAGNINNLNPTTKSFTQFKGQEGDAITWDYAMCLLAARNGDVWLGTNSGIISFNPSDAFGEGEFIVNHIKVLAEDGVTEEYLADGIQVNCIAEDNTGRKFIGTHTNGLYILNPEGNRVINHFTTENSELQANSIYNVAYNEQTHSILIVTMNGVCEYVLDTHSASDYSGVTVGPNPVRPDYTGYVIIDNLMEQSTVQIVGPDGKVYLETVAQGGSCVWNCCDDTGNRVPTGTYTVLATQQGTPTPVAQFLVIK